MFPCLPILVKILPEANLLLEASTFGKNTNTSTNKAPGLPSWKNIE
jgi:hypothetical protein